MRRSTAIQRAVLVPRGAPRRHLSVGSPQPAPVPVPRPLAPHQRRQLTTLATHTKKPLFDKILIANRGEIACRVMKTAQALGIKCVAVFSEADRDSLHVRMADEAYLLGPAPSSESYLRADKIIAIAQACGATAIHPGYGFLSESAAMAQALEEHGITFIGPPASAIVSMGSKSESKDIMLKAGVPCVPGWHPAHDSPASTQLPEFLVLEADKIGYPVLIKAVSGGGGKGMKIVERREDFVGQLESAKREAMKGFGDDKVLLERYLKTPRHVEVQIFSDTHGAHLSLFERDCSVQRRHQKIIEEAPAPGLSQALREDLFDKARKAAAAVNYVGAGTVEFIMDASESGGGEFYFMEMNTRLQVEHPVTEAITGIDLVEWQLLVAAGNPIPLTQEQITCTGHAFECRIYAEQPRNNFLPDTGMLRHVRLPPVGKDIKDGGSVRMETGFVAGDDISVFYDPLIAKLIVYGSDRTEALRVLRKALGDYQIVGPATNIEFLKRLCENDAFIEGDVETGFIAKHHDALFAPPVEASASTLAQAGLFVALRHLATPRSTSSARPASPWVDTALAGFRAGGVTGFKQTVVLSEPSALGVPSRTATVDVGAPSKTGAYQVIVVDFDGTTTSFSAVTPTFVRSPTSTSVSALLGAKLAKIDVVAQPLKQLEGSGPGGEQLSVFNVAEGFVGTLEVRPPAWTAALGRGSTVAKGSARAPMPSRIIQILVRAGDIVDAGMPLCVVEAMKSELVLRAPKAGVVRRVIGAVGDLVPEGKVLVEFEEDSSE